MKNKLILLLAIVFGCVSAFGIFQYMRTMEATYQLSGDYTQVATAKQVITARSIIHGSMLEFIEVPVEYVMGDAVLDPADAVGKMARGDIFPGEQIMTQKLMTREDQTGGLAVRIDEGKRAVAIPVGLVSSLHGLLNVNDQVDVLVTFSYEEETTEAETGRRVDKQQVATSTIIHNAPVLAINNRIHSASEDNQEASTVTIMVGPDEAQLIALAIQQGSIQFTLRSPEDDAETVIPMVGIDGLKR